MSKSDDCSSNIHEFCNQCDCPCHGLQISLEEARAIYKELEHQYIPYEHREAHEAIDKIYKFVKDNKDELARDYRKST
jgi:hypothetical protein